MAPARVVVVGGTGVLGSAVAVTLAGLGHDVVLASRRPPRSAPLTALPHARLDVLDPGDDLHRALAGADAVVLAAGADDRAPFPRPVDAALQRGLVDPSQRVARAARAAGAGAVVVLGSYFTAVDRERPDLRLAARHPYVRARLRQHAAMRAAAGPVPVALLEVPYVAGTGPAGPPRWPLVLLEHAQVGPLVPYPRGGSLMTSVGQVGDAAARAVDVLLAGGGTEGAHGAGATWPVGERVACWDEVFRELGAGAGRPLRYVPVPRALTTAGALAVGARLALRGRAMGLDARYVVPDVIGRVLDVDTTASRRALRYAPVDVAAALREQGAACLRRGAARGR